MSERETNTRFQLALDVALQEHPGGLLLVNLETGKAWELDLVGADFCRRLDGSKSVTEITTELLEIYDVSNEVLSHDIKMLLEERTGVGLVEPVAS